MSHLTRKDIASVDLACGVAAEHDRSAEQGVLKFVGHTGNEDRRFAPIDGQVGFDEVAGFAHGVAEILVKRDPDHLTMEFSKADRGGRILVDTWRNAWGATFAAVYAVRSKPGAPVSAPCTWAELERGTVDPRTFTLRTMAERIADVGDLWADMRQAGRALPLEALAAKGGPGPARSARR